MFELFKMLEAAEHIHEAIVIGDSILFTFENKKIRLQATNVEDVFKLLEEDTSIDEIKIKFNLN